MEFLILGPLEVRGDDGPIRLGGPKPRAVLAVLALEAGRAVSAGRLVTEVWGAEAPHDAMRRLHTTISRLRSSLGDSAAIEHTQAGYRLRLDAGQLDLERFQRDVRSGRAELESGDAAGAAESLRAALALWRGPPLAGLEEEPFAAEAIARLVELRLEATEARLDADLALRRARAIVPELQVLVDEYPLRERLVWQLMLALYRSGRQADALKVYKAARARLVADAAVEPGASLQRLHAQILRQDRSLLDPGQAELPREIERALDGPLEGREPELAWLRDCWVRARAGAGTLVTISGRQGIGKSRLAAEFAAEAHTRGATVLFIDASGSAVSSLGVLEHARSTAGPTLLIVDNADRAPESVREALGTLRDALDGAPMLAVVLDERGTDDEHGGLRLLPLGIGAVQAIVTQYVPPDWDDQPPTESLLGRSGGVPAAVHDLGRQWADRVTARQRVRERAPRAAALRASLHASELELADDVEEALDVPFGNGDGAHVCPFKGLASFQAADAPYFCGRERLVAELVARLIGARLLGIVGSSGSGKSSVLRAGLLPALAAGVLPGSADWPQILIRPGAHPLAELKAALAAHPDPARVVAIDQFEELFTLCDDERERADFVEALAEAARESESRGAVMLAIRADFYGRCAAYPELSAMLGPTQVLVGAMADDELREAIEVPAERAGLLVDRELSDQLVAEVKDQPGGLPLLSTALLELWQQRDGQRLRRASGHKDGVVKDAVERLGERAYERLDEPGRVIARRVLVSLAAVDEEHVERRRVPPAELGDDAGKVIAALADDRILTVDEGTVEIAHEALLRTWPRLAGWIEDDRDTLRVYGRLRRDATEWQRLDRDGSALMRGAVLEEARAHVVADAPRLNALEREYLTVSVARHRRGRRLRIGALSAAVVAILAVVLVINEQRRQTESKRIHALSRSLALASGQALAVEPELALRLALLADQTQETQEAEVALREATLAFRQVDVMRADQLAAQAVAYSPNGRQIVTGGEEGGARIWDAETGREVARHEFGGSLKAARWAPDGSRIAFASDRGVFVTSAALESPERLSAEAAVDVAIAGERVAAAIGEDVHVFGAATFPAGGTLTALDMGEDGRIVTGDDSGTVKVWDAGGALLRDLDGEAPVRGVRFSPVAQLVLAVTDDGWARIWDTVTGEERLAVRPGPRPLAAAEFSRDGRRFVTGGHDGAVRVWETAGGSQLFELRGQLSRVLAVGFGNDADRVVSGGDDGRARVWNTAGIVSFTSDAKLAQVGISPSGRWIATGGWDGDVRLFDAATSELVDVARGPGTYASAYFAPIADELVIGQDGRSEVQLWTPPGENVRAVASTNGNGMNVARYDPTGTRLIYADYQTGALSVLDQRSGRRWQLRGGPDKLWDAQMSPDGKLVVAGGEEGALLVWDLDRPERPIHKWPGHSSHINVINYSQDGRVVTAGADRTARIWNPATGDQLVLRGHTDELDKAVFTPDGERVLTASADGTSRLWDSRTGDFLATLQDTPDSPLSDISQGPDGVLATLDDNHVVRVFTCTVCGTLDQVRAAARKLGPRELTPTERQRFLAD